MKKIYKYEIYMNHHKQETIIYIPEGSVLLDIEEQNASLYAWFEVNFNNNEEDRTFESKTFCCMHTGSEFDSINLIFKKTIVISSSYVIHVYEKIPFLNKDEFKVD